MTQIPNIYKINRDYYQLNGLTSAESIIEKIVSSSFKRLGYKREYNSSDLKYIERDEISYYLYLFNSDEMESDWKQFLPTDLIDDTKFVIQKLSLLLFIETEYELFCVIGGGAYQIIVSFIDHSFGLNLYSRIMKPEEDMLTSIKSRGITGSRAGMNEQFRDNYRIIDFIRFGKIPQEIHLKLSDEITNLYFKFLKTKNNERMLVSVGKAFKIKKSIDFDDLHKIIKELSTISELAPSDYLSSYEEIKNHVEIESTYKQHLILQIFNDIQNIGKDKFELHKRFEHDFCNPNNIQVFYEADEYKLKEKSSGGGYSVFATVTDREEIYDTVLKRASDLHGNSFFNFRAYLQGVLITCYRNNIRSISSGFLFHISAEFNIKNTPLFLVDTKWYHLRDSFLSDLQTSSLHILKTYKAPSHIVNMPWNKNTIHREGEYNLQYNGKSNYIVIDTIIEDGLELCDILHYDSTNLYLIHVKYGFGSKMREVTNQISISARRLKDLIGTRDRKYFEKIYNKLLSKGRSVDDLTLNEFINLFHDKTITYVLAFSSHLSDDLAVENNIDKYESNIARFSLVQCSGEMRSQYYMMLIKQIERV